MSRYRATIEIQLDVDDDVDEVVTAAQMVTDIASEEIPGILSCTVRSVCEFVRMRRGPRWCLRWTSR